jgi:hypothetical protein
MLFVVVVIFVSFNSHRLSSLLHIAVCGCCGHWFHLNSSSSRMEEEEEEVASVVSVFFARESWGV